MTETRQQMIDRLIDERERRIADEAERYKDKRMAEHPAPGYVTVVHLIGHLVRLKLGDPLVKGVVFGFDVRQVGVTYHVAWGDRQSTEHYDFELEAVEPD